MPIVPNAEPIPTEELSVYLRELDNLRDDIKLVELVGSCREHLSQHGEPISFMYPDVRAARDVRLGSRVFGTLRLGIFVTGLCEEMPERKTLVGCITAHPDEDNEQMVMVSYWLGKQFTGNGYATFALNALCQDLRQDYPIIYAYAVNDNAASIELLRRGDFHRVNRNGQYGTYVYSPAESDIQTQRKVS